MLGTTWPIVPRRIPEDLSRHLQCCENLRVTVHCSRLQLQVTVTDKRFEPFGLELLLADGV
jgi:hypothetical protein